MTDEIGDKGISYPNITREEIVALKELAENHSITIKSADKSGAIVVMDTQKYMCKSADCYLILMSTDYFQVIRSGA